MENDPHDIEARIDRLLDQLEARNITQAEIERIEKKVRVLRTMQQ